MQPFKPMAVSFPPNGNNNKTHLTSEFLFFHVIIDDATNCTVTGDKLGKWVAIKIITNRATVA